jgi:hypothetical protein
MRFKDAVELKSTLPQEVFYNETWMKIYIVPVRDTDFNKFMNYYSVTNTTIIDDSTAKRFCSNDDYTLHGLAKIGTYNLFLNLPNLLDICNQC